MAKKKTKEKLFLRRMIADSDLNGVKYYRSTRSMIKKNKILNKSEKEKLIEKLEETSGFME